MMQMFIIAGKEYILSKKMRVKKNNIQNVAVYLNSAGITDQIFRQTVVDPCVFPADKKMILTCFMFVLSIHFFCLCCIIYHI